MRNTLVFVRQPVFKNRDEPPKTFSRVCEIETKPFHDLRLEDFYDEEGQYTVSFRIENPWYPTKEFDISTRQVNKLIAWAKKVHERQRKPTFIVLSSTGLASLVMALDRVDVYLVVEETKYEWLSFLYPVVQVRSTFGVGELEITSRFIYVSPNFWYTETGKPLSTKTLFPNPYSTTFDTITAQQAQTTKHDDMLSSLLLSYRHEQTGDIIHYECETLL